MRRESFAEYWRDPKTRATHFKGALYDKDYDLDSPERLAQQVKAELVREITKRVMEAVIPRLDRVISKAIEEFSNE
jgi:hypothetical protein